MITKNATLLAGLDHFTDPYSGGLVPSVQSSVTLVLADLCDQEAINYAAFSARPRLIWVETPTNPAWKISDIAKIAAIARQAGATLTVDATVATPLLRNCAGKPGYSAIPPR